MLTNILSNAFFDDLAIVFTAENVKPLSFILKEGMSLGKNKAELKAILPGGIVLVEKFKNVYDQDEYLETIIPVSRTVEQ